MSALTIRKARPDETEAVRAFYHRLITEMRDAPFFPQWEIDVYPTDTYLNQAVLRGEMYIGLCGEEIACSMALSRDMDEDCSALCWLTNAAADEIMVVHVLCVLPAFSRRGFGKALVRHAQQESRALGCKSLRLDVLEGNLPAERLYTSLGFRYVGPVRTVFSEDDFLDFRMFECPLDP